MPLCICTLINHGNVFQKKLLVQEQKKQLQVKSTQHLCVLQWFLQEALNNNNNTNNNNNNNNKVQTKAAAPLQHLLFLCLYKGVETKSAAPSLFF